MITGIDLSFMPVMIHERNSLFLPIETKRIKVLNLITFRLTDEI